MVRIIEIIIIIIIIIIISIIIFVSRSTTVRMVFTNIAEGKSCSDYEFSRSSILLQDHLLGNSSAKMFLKN